MLVWQDVNPEWIVSSVDLESPHTCPSALLPALLCVFSVVWGLHLVLSVLEVVWVPICLSVAVLTAVSLDGCGDAVMFFSCFLLWFSLVAQELYSPRSDVNQSQGGDSNKRKTL